MRAEIQGWSRLRVENQASKESSRGALVCVEITACVYIAGDRMGGDNTSPHYECPWKLFLRKCPVFERKVPSPSSWLLEEIQKDRWE